MWNTNSTETRIVHNGHNYYSKNICRGKQKKAAHLGQPLSIKQFIITCKASR